MCSKTNLDIKKIIFIATIVLLPSLCIVAFDPRGLQNSTSS